MDSFSLGHRVAIAVFGLSLRRIPVRLIHWKSPERGIVLWLTK